MKTRKQAVKQTKKNGKAAAAAATTPVIDLRSTKAKGAAKAEKPAAGPKRTIKQVVIEVLTAHSAATNREMIAIVKDEFPNSAFDESHAAWYRTQARKGKLTGTPIAIPPIVRKQSDPKSN
jgi:hypothetical protein